MKLCKTHLLAATAAAGMFSATGANAAAVPYPAATINGNGASSIIVVLNKTERCLGVNNAIGFGADGTTQAFPDHTYTPVSPTTANPVWNCASQDIQPDIKYQYVSTGSGGGRTNWSKWTTSGIVVAPAGFGYGDHVHYAISDTAITGTNLTDYDTLADIPAHPAGPAIQIPFYVLPVAIAYKPVYGIKDTPGGPVNLSFNVKATFVQKDGHGDPAGGLRMKKATYCAILNGTITNWNDAQLKTDNGGQSLMDPADDLARWNSTGVPIRLVGRNENSGTTNLFTRHLAAACAGTAYSGLGGTDQLPASLKSTARYDKADGHLVSGAEAAGKFGLVDGSDGVASTIGRDIPVPAPGSNATNLGGFLGYVGGDFVRPATVGTSIPLLHSAALQQGSTTAFKMPTAANATAAFGTGYLPPQSCATGKYCPASPAPGSAGNRNDPLAWALSSSATTGLANPAKGYPIVGTTNLLLYTCYASPAVRAGIVALAGLQFGKLAQSKSGTKFPVALVNSTGKDPLGYQLGVLARNGLSNLPGQWKTAIWETFFTKVATGNNPASLNLWIQDKLPTTAALIDGNPGNGEVKANDTGPSAVCTAGSGA